MHPFYRFAIARNKAYLARSKTARKTRFSKTRSVSSRRPPGRRGILQKYNVHSYKRYAPTQTLSVSSGVYADTKVFTLSDVSGSSELTALYDSYKITGVKLMFRLNTNPDSNTLPGSGTQANTTNTYPSMWYSRDYDNSDAEGITVLQQRNTAKSFVLKPDKVYSIFLRPALRNQLYLDGTSSAHSSVWNQWLDCSTTTTPHYGLKYAFDPNGANSNAWVIRIECIYYLKFKNTR